MDPARDRMRIAETFVSRQGEGGLAGAPSFFIRTTGCNLRCEWCDTPYTSWEPEGVWQDIDALVAAVPAGTRHVVVTGGEPMLWAPLPRLTAGLGARGCHVTIETAGTRYLDLACDLMSISPKLANSNPGPERPAAVRDAHRTERLNPALLRQLLDSYVCQLKFVIAEPSDLGELDTLLAELPAVLPQTVMLMPLGTTRAELEARRPWLTALCRERGFRYSPRLHIELWGDRRGV